LITATISEKDVSRVKAAFDGVPGAYETAVDEVATRIRKLVLGRTTYVTGNLQRGWSEVSKSVQSGGFSFSFGNDVDYAPTHEFGEYQKVGPRTAEARTQEGAPGIFSRGTISGGVGGMIGPVFDPTVLESLGKMVVDYMISALKNA